MESFRGVESSGGRFKTYGVMSRLMKERNVTALYNITNENVQRKALPLCNMEYF